ncbi:MAG: hypothetical protein PHP42_12170 [Bacteroidota bacterium]|nr:hypothetical protein [Bacteroidota bacterium]
MKRSMLIALLAICQFSIPFDAFSQAWTTAVPFLLISPSVESNGMGGVMLSVTPTSPSAMIFNPAQLGMMSQTHTFSTDFYSDVTLWLPHFHLSDLWINSYSFMYGLKLDSSLHNNMSVGIGYSRVLLNLGEFIATTENGGQILGSFHGQETSDNYSLGFAMDVGVRLGFGTTIKKINSDLGMIGLGTHAGPLNADVTAFDLGIIAKAPLIDLLFKEEAEQFINFIPTFDFSLAYAINNIGGNVSYGDAAQSDPLPRNARLGWSIEAGIKYDFNAQSYTLLTLTFAREAENILATRTPNGGIGDYKGPIGDIDIYQNLILSKQKGYVEVRKGFAIGFLETFTYRQGSYNGDGNLNYTTEGYSLSSRGIVKLIASTLKEENGFDLRKYFLEHFEIRFSQSEYSNHDLLGGTKFNNIIFSFYQ